MITLKEIAEIANVSRGTVDKVIHDRQGVSDETRARVKDILEKHKYVPSKAGKLLVGLKKEISIAVISIFNEDKDYFSMVRTGIDLAYKELKSYGLKLRYFFIEKNNEECIFQALNDLMKENFNAIILPPHNSEKMRDYLTEISDMGIHIVTYSTDILNAKRLFFVGNDYYKSGITAASLMAKLLCNSGDIVVFEGDAGVKCHEDRVEGFLNYISEFFRKSIFLKKLVNVLLN